MTNRRILMLMIVANAVLAAASLLAGFAAGHRLLVSTGLSWLASELDSIPDSSGVVGILLMPVVFAIGIGLYWKGVSESLMRSATRGTLIDSSIHVVPRDPDDGYRVHSRVAYCIDGVRYESEGAHETILPTEAEAKRIVEMLHPGDPVQVFYRPGDPEAVNLDAPPGQTMIVRLLGLLIALNGLGLAFMNGVVLSR